MPELTMTAPKFEALLHSETRPANQSVVLVFGTADKKRFALEFSATCAPLAIAALAAELGRLLAQIPDAKRPPVQGIRAIGTQTAMKDDGTPTLLLHLESGAELPLEFQTSDLPKLRSQIDELTKMTDTTGHH